jgi:hypothetical protein
VRGVRVLQNDLPMAKLHAATSSADGNSSIGATASEFADAAGEPSDRAGPVGESSPAHSLDRNLERCSVDIADQHGEHLSLSSLMISNPRPSSSAT